VFVALCPIKYKWSNYNWGPDSPEIYGEVEEIVGGEWLAFELAFAFTGLDLLVVFDAMVVQHVEEQLLAARNNRSHQFRHHHTRLS
jgi:hypothetical protein